MWVLLTGAVCISITVFASRECRWFPPTAVGTLPLFRPQPIVPQQPKGRRSSVQQQNRVEYGACSGDSPHTRHTRIPNEVESIHHLCTSLSNAPSLFAPRFFRKNVRKWCTQCTICYRLSKQREYLNVPTRLDPSQDGTKRCFGQDFCSKIVAVGRCIRL